MLYRAWLPCMTSPLPFLIMPADCAVSSHPFLSSKHWRDAFCPTSSAISWRNENVVAIKIAPFNRYQPGCGRAVADSGRARVVAIYTGNDDYILLDLLTEFHFGVERSRFFG